MSYFSNFCEEEDHEVAKKVEVGGTTDLYNYAQRRAMQIILHERNFNFFFLNNNDIGYESREQIRVFLEEKCEYAEMSINDQKIVSETIEWVIENKIASSAIELHNKMADVAVQRFVGDVVDLRAKDRISFCNSFPKFRKIFSDDFQKKWEEMLPLKRVIVAQTCYGVVCKPSPSCFDLAKKLDVSGLKEEFSKLQRNGINEGNFVYNWLLENNKYLHEYRKVLAVIKYELDMTL